MQRIKLSRPEFMDFTPQAEQQILQRFGKQALRPGQRRLIELVLAGQDALGVLPTGHGKSLCYQAAACLLGGTTLVVSPLIALMRDQCQALLQWGIPAARYDSTLPEPERAEVLQGLRTGAWQILFVAPESLGNTILLELLRARQLSLMVVDEAHCVSEWGHSFRPDYLQLPGIRQQLRPRSVLALTATATPRVQEDLRQAFGIAEEACVLLSPYRSHIRRLCRSVEDRRTALLRFLREEETPLPAIVYCRSRKETEQVALFLADAGFSTAHYHAGLPADVRERLQDDFLAGRISLLVATIAFGMGVDKADVRSVIHYSVPSSPESYLQESGRAGRDGLPCTSLVLLHGGDVTDARNRIRAAEPDAEGVLRAVRWMLPPLRRVVSLWELGTNCDVPEDVPTRILRRLESVVEVEARGYKWYKAKPLFPISTITAGRETDEVSRLLWLNEHREAEVEEAALAWNCCWEEALSFLRDCEQAGEWKISLRQQALSLRTLRPVSAKEIAQELSDAFARRRADDEARLETMLRMFSAPHCLNLALQAYFGFPVEAPGCGHCSACLGSAPALPEAALPPMPNFAPGDLPDFDRNGQRRRFLLGIASPGLMARRLWAHPLYGCCAAHSWEQLG